MSQSSLTGTNNDFLNAPCHQVHQSLQFGLDSNLMLSLFESGQRSDLYVGSAVYHGSCWYLFHTLPHPVHTGSYKLRTKRKYDFRNNITDEKLATLALPSGLKTCTCTISMKERVMNAAKVFQRRFSSFLLSFPLYFF